MHAVIKPLLFCRIEQMAEDLKHEMVSRAKLCEQAERYDDMADYMRQVTESGIGRIISVN